MKAILLAAGLGTRLKPLTDWTPKCLMKINGVPLLEIWLNKLFEANIESVLINTHYLSSSVIDYLANSKYQEKITIVHEPVLLGTAATLIKNLTFFEGRDGLLIHADNYCTADLKKFIQMHTKRPVSCEISMMTFTTDQPQNCGIVVINKQNIVIEFYEKQSKPPGNLANGAVYILSSSCLEEIEKKFLHAKDFSLEILNTFMNRIYSIKNNDVHIDIGTLENYKKAIKLNSL